jgi:general secretion pathway protein D
MKLRRKYINMILTAGLVGCLLAFIAHDALAQTSRTQRPAANQTANRSANPQNANQQFVSIDFNNVDINVLIKFISELTGRNFVIDQRVKGKVTILSPSKISVAEAYKVFESVLEVHGYTTVQAGEVTKIIPAPDAKAKSIETRIREEAGSPEDRIVTQIIPLKYADPNEVKRLFAPLISKASVLLAYAPTNMLIVTDVYSNIMRLMKILKTIDVSGIGQELTVIPIQNADATKLVKTLGTVFKQQGAPKKGQVTKPVQFVADERTNTVILLASEDYTLRIKRLIVMLDKELPRGQENIRVYYMEHADAEDLAKVLQEIPSKQSAAKTTGKKEAPVVSSGVKITADKATNSLIIMGEKEDYAVLEEIIAKLDIPRSMVYIEALIMEVNITTGFSLGTQWTALGEATIDNKETVFGGSFRGGASTEDLSSAGDFALGVAAGAIDLVINGTTITFPNIGAVVTAFQTDDDIRILSTPQILTTDNEEASITVGENRPFQTTTTTTTSSDTFNSFEYRDVGKILKITPHISKDRMVRLVISLKVDSVNLAATTVGTQPVTSKRTVDTTVIVRDGHTLVIGGLIDDNLTTNESKVPCLGDIPFFRPLFRFESEDVVKTNLYVFITPRVVRNPEEADEVSRRKRNEMDQISGGSIKLYDSQGTQKQPTEIQ